MINPEPLMFIDSAKTLNQNKNQVVYDSRYKPIKKEEPIKVINQEVLLKIDGIIELYQKVKPIVCDIVASNNNYQGIPYSKDEEYLYIKQNRCFIFRECCLIIKIIQDLYSNSSDHDISNVVFTAYNVWKYDIFDFVFLLFSFLLSYLSITSW